MSIHLSVVIPTYQRPLLLRKCLNTLMVQYFPKGEYEVIVVSDGPDKNTRQLINEFQVKYPGHPAIRFFCLPHSSGPAAARNRGWKMATGDLVAFTDDDCIPNIWWLRALWNEYHRQKTVVLKGKIIVPRKSLPTDYEHNVSLIEKAAFVTANCACPKKLLEQVNGFDENFSAAWREDSDLEFKFLNQHITVKRIERALVVHPVRHARWGISLKEQRKSMFNALLYKKHPLLYRERIQAHPPWLYYGIIASCLAFWICLFISGWIWVSILAFLLWLCLQSKFISKRLAGHSRRLSHVTEMIVTSFFIPFLSVFWRLWGAIKFRVLFF